MVRELKLTIVSCTNGSSSESALLNGIDLPGKVFIGFECTSFFVHLIDD